MQLLEFGENSIGIPGAIHHLTGAADSAWSEFGI
jgi:hypothetical protein